MTIRLVILQLHMPRHAYTDRRLQATRTITPLRVGAATFQDAVTMPVDSIVRLVSTVSCVFCRSNGKLT